MKKPKIRYTLEQKSKDVKKRNKPELVIGEINAGFVSIIGNNKKYQRVKYSLEVTILPKNFGLSEKNFKLDKDVFAKFSKSNAGVKNKMEKLERAVDAIYSNYEINDTYPTAKEFKGALEIRMGRKERERILVPTLLEFLLTKIENDIKNIDSSKKEELQFNTIKSYKTLSKYIENYEYITNTPLTFDRLDVDIYWNFWDVQDEILRGIKTVIFEDRTRKQQVKKNGFLVNSICKYQKTLIKVMRLAKKSGIEIILDLDDENLVLESKPNSKDLYLNQDSLEKIINSKVNTREFEQAKDYVILASLLGMRYESMKDGFGTPIEECNEGAYNFKHIYSKQPKTGTEVIIPLLKPVQKVISRHNNEFPKFSSNQEINRWLKELFTELKITVLEKITYHTYKLGVISEQKPINEVISTHDFKKTFYSNLSLMMVNESVIDNVTHPDKTPNNPMGKIVHFTVKEKAFNYLYDNQRLLIFQVVPTGIEPVTQGFSVLCSTN